MNIAPIFTTIAITLPYIGALRNYIEEQAKDSETSRQLFANIAKSTGDSDCCIG
jgi:hypothetical protein